MKKSKKWIEMSIEELEKNQKKFNYIGTFCMICAFFVFLIVLYFYFAKIEIDFLGMFFCIVLIGLTILMNIIEFHIRTLIFWRKNL